jgi:iron complex outermembrane receptor protein
MINPTIRNAVRFALTAGVAASFVNAPAFAADDDDSTKLDRVEVTGSRIKRTQLEGAMPVTTVTREDIEKTGLSNIGDLLQELPAAGAALNTNFNNGGTGATTIDLRNLGSNRVLVLVNGRRWVDNVGGGLGSSVDLNTIPLTIIERVEVLKDGASAVYGSDAIAGVINIITRRDFDGAQANATIGEFDEGDGRQELYDFSLGSSGSKASAFFNVTYYKQEAVFAGDRDISREPVFHAGYGEYDFDSPTKAGSQPSATDSFCEQHDMGLTGILAGQTPATYGLCGVYGSGTTPNGRFSIGTPAVRDAFSHAILVPSNPAGTFPTGARTRGSLAGDTTPGIQANGTEFFSFSHNNRYNFAPDNYLATPGERYSLFASGRYDITDNVTFVTEALYNKRESDQKLASMPVIVGSAAGAVIADGQFIGIDATNPYNPTGFNLIPVAYCANDGQPTAIPCNGASVANPAGWPSATNRPLNFIARRFVEGGTRNFYQAVQTWRFGAGFEGNFEAIGRVWDWNVNYVYALSENTERQQGLFDTTKIKTALGPLANCVGTCVPMDLFSGVGGLTPAMLDYVGSTTHDVQQSELRNYTGNISGELFDLPAGPVGLAAGYEYRQQAGLDEPDGLLQGGNSTGNNRQATNGGYSVSELYAEFAIRS